MFLSIYYTRRCAAVHSFSSGRFLLPYRAAVLALSLILHTSYACAPPVPSTRVRMRTEKNMISRVLLTKLKKMGVSTAAFPSHFKNKLELFFYFIFLLFFAGTLARYKKEERHGANLFSPPSLPIIERRGSASLPCHQLKTSHHHHHHSRTRMTTSCGRRRFLFRWRLAPRCL